MRREVNERERSAADPRVRGSRPAPRKRKKHKRNLTLYYILFAVLFLSTAIALSLTVFFKIEEITVTGTEHYPQEQLVRATGVTIGDNLFRIDKEAIIQGLLEFPYIEQATVRRDYPPSLYISVVEAVPAAAVRDGDHYTLLSAKGRILETGVSELPEGAPVVTGLSVEHLSTGQFIPEEQGENLTMLAYLIEAIQKTGFTGITLIDLSDRLNLVAVFENRIVIEFGSEGNLEYKLRFASEVIHNKLEENFEGVVDLSIHKELHARPMNITKIYPDISSGFSHALPEIPEELEEPEDGASSSASQSGTQDQSSSSDDSEDSTQTQ